MTPIDMTNFVDNVTHGDPVVNLETSERRSSSTTKYCPPSLTTHLTGDVICYALLEDAGVEALG